MASAQKKNRLVDDWLTWVYLARLRCRRATSVSPYGLPFAYLDTSDQKSYFRYYGQITYPLSPTCHPHRRLFNLFIMPAGTFPSIDPLVTQTSPSNTSFSVSHRETSTSLLMEEFGFDAAVAAVSRSSASALGFSGR